VLETRHKGDVIAPGQFKKHYSPGIPVYLNQTKAKAHGALLVLGKHKIADNIFFSASVPPCKKRRAIFIFFSAKQKN
jgi:SUA5 domain.